MSIRLSIMFIEVAFPIWHKCYITKFQDSCSSEWGKIMKIKGIDISHWQGSVDFKKVKDAGATFAMIRLGYQDGIKGNYVLDSYFEKIAEDRKIEKYIGTF